MHVAQVVQIMHIVQIVQIMQVVQVVQVVQVAQIVHIVQIVQIIENTTAVETKLKNVNQRMPHTNCKSNEQCFFYDAQSFPHKQQHNPSS